MMHRSNRQSYLNSMKKLVEPDPHQLMSVLGAFTVSVINQYTLLMVNWVRDVSSPFTIHPALLTMTINVSVIRLI